MRWDFFEDPVLVRFNDDESNRYIGVAYQDLVICLCCGGVLELEEVNNTIEFICWLSEEEIQMLLDEREEK